MVSNIIKVVLRKQIKNREENKANGSNNIPIFLIHSRNGTKATLNRPSKSRFADSTGSTNFIEQMPVCYVKSTVRYYRHNNTQ